MTMSGSLQTALTGLTAAGRAAQVVSSNVSNALTEGYGKREIQLSSTVLGGVGTGVRVKNVLRHSDPLLIGNRRLAQAQLGQVSVRLEFFNTMETTIGLPDDPGSLTGRMTDFDSALIEAASRPDSQARLQAVIDRARAVTNHLNTLSDQVQSERMHADQAIARSVDTLNASLNHVATLNKRILQFKGNGRDANALFDQRQTVIDGIADLVPLREVARDNGTVALYTPTGTTLLDGKAAVIGFAPAGLILPDMSVASGALSGLTINGKPAATDTEKGPLAGGRLTGLFELRDVRAPAVQSRLDAVARDIVERFQDSSVDPSLPPGAPGLFTDAGAPLSVPDELGLAGRISLNAAVDPSQGGALWRLRDGLGTAGPGDPGDATLLNALTGALDTSRLPATGGFVVPRSVAGLSGDLLSGISVAATFAESEQSFAQTQTDTLIGLELKAGVDTDEEMQKLLLIEQTYSANARVITAIDQLIQTLLGL